jgi:NhaA family Na+:H+ antiporter
MIIPALVFTAFNQGESFAMKGWAIPTATDIAFALGAIVIIALFYTSELSTLSIIIASLSLVALFIMNRMGVINKTAYILIGIILWVSVLKSGVHATLAGVALAFMIPLNSKDKKGVKFSMLKEMEHGLHYWVVFMILPLFAFVNAGVNLQGISIDEMSASVPLGIMLGLQSLSQF